ncbi:MAG: 2-deoxy-scyllo-inosamine dehydrogenase [Planctomycetota bacterium]
MTSRQSSAARGPAESMRAVVVRDGRAAVERVAAPPPADDGVHSGIRGGTHAGPQAEVLVRPLLALLTPLDREVVRGLGATGSEPRIAGTAAVAVVERSPAGHALRRGDRVVVQPVLSCGACERCRSGLSIHCAGRRLVGIDAPGALAERLALPATACLPIPDGLDDAHAVFAAPLARAVEAVRRGGVARRSFASVLGDDLLAVLATLVAVEENPLARLVSSSEATLRIAEQLGIRHRLAAETGRRGDQELVIDTTGSSASIEAATRMVRPRGHVVVAGLGARGGVAVDLSHLALDEIEVHGSGFGPFAGALGMLAQGAIDPTPLVSRRCGLDDAPRALGQVGDDGVLSVLVQVDR